jgi:hypothetical protein
MACTTWAPMQVGELGGELKVIETVFEPHLPIANDVGKDAERRKLSKLLRGLNCAEVRK